MGQSCWDWGAARAISIGPWRVGPGPIIRFRPTKNWASTFIQENQVEKRSDLIEIQRRMATVLELLHCSLQMRCIISFIDFHTDPQFYESWLHFDHILMVLLHLKHLFLWGWRVLIEIYEFFSLVRHGRLLQLWLVKEITVLIPSKS